MFITSIYKEKCLSLRMKFSGCHDVDLSIPFCSLCICTGCNTPIPVPSIPIKEQCVFVGLSVCLLFIGHTTFVHFAALPPSTPRAAKPSRAAPRAGKHACTAIARARMPYNFSTKKSYADAFQKENRTRAHVVVYVTADKKREKENQHATSQVQFTVCLLLECLLFESYWIVFFTNRVCWPPWNHGEPGDLPSLRWRG